ncbi:Protein kinase [Orpheovirus IHUMI-LCC2]|uniref:Protein kinase n=1 Tax=Orpheovirus IHUMI-LCC2 TaxID=2023057 RepID=A0A2I2L513_9VIRU|nr:Protein kinase [Orpheovirus IHUMI-LCC2]SNW62645.1 Protein kinase [Orpheovirus IHUMI-LCC2]
MLNTLFQRLSQDNTLYKNFIVNNNISKDKQIYSNIREEYNYIYNNYYDEEFTDDIFELEERKYFNPNVYRYNDTVVKSVDKDTLDQFNGLIHECFILLHISKMYPEMTQSIIDIKLTGDTLFLITRYEKGQTLEEYLDSYFNNKDLDSIKILLGKTFNVLGKLYETYKFTHYDLHLQNLIIDDNNNIKIIDFASSHIILDGVTYGVTSTYSLNTYTLILPNYFWPYDIFKLLCLIREKFDYKLRNKEIEDKLSHTLYNYNISISKLDNIVKEFEKNINNNDYEEYDSMEEFNEFYSEAKNNLDTKINNRDNEINKYKKQLEGIKVIKEDVRYINLLEVLISYFLNIRLIEEYYNKTKFYDAVRVDIFSEYDEYLTNYEHFYEFSTSYTNFI